MSDNPYYRELVDFRQTLQDWFNGLTLAADENETFTRILRVAPEDSVCYTISHKNGGTLSTLLTVVLN